MQRTLPATMLLLTMTGLLTGLARGQDAPPAAKDPQAAVPVRKVVLFSSGVGYFEHSGSVTGNGSTELHFKAEQINDILKSLVLEDLGNGTISTVTYPSQDPLAKTLRSFQVDISANPPLGELLNQLRGAKVKVTAGGEQIQGTILGLEKKQKPAGDKGVIEVWSLNIINGASIRAIDLDSVLQLELQDPQLQEELSKALAALAQARDQEKKPVIVNFVGQGQREVRIGYVVETPIWKASYRLMVSADPKGKSNLQGWAIVENQTDNDWNDISLSLVSGRPISFIEDLYQPLYVPRPTLVPELFESLMPHNYEEGSEAQPEAAANFSGGRLQLAGALARQMDASRRHGQGAGQQGNLFGAGASAEGTGREIEDQTKSMDATASIASLASAGKIGELFQYEVDHVSLARQRSAMIPIVTDPIEVEPLSIYNEQVLPRNPLTGARLKNTTGKHLLGGPITVFSHDDKTGDSYAGDASIESLPPGQERLISYGVDLQMLVDADKNTQEDQQIVSGKIVKGVMHVKRRLVFSQDYLADNKSDKDKTLIIEHPLRQGWHLVDTDKPIETTDTLYRFKGTVPAGKSSKLTVKEEIVQDEEYEILPWDLGSIDFYAKTGEISKNVRDVLTQAATMKRAMVDTQRQIDEKNAVIEQITQEQQRIRANITTIGHTGDYYKRLLAKLNDQETTIEGAQQAIKTLQATLDGQQKELENYLVNATVE